jgi:hypothetical protein
MRTVRSHGVMVLLALALLALQPWTAIAGDASGVIMPDPGPGRPNAAADPDIPIGTIVVRVPIALGLLPTWLWVPSRSVSGAIVLKRASFGGPGESSQAAPQGIRRRGETPR